MFSYALAYTDLFYLNNLKITELHWPRFNIYLFCSLFCSQKIIYKPKQIH